MTVPTDTETRTPARAVTPARIVALALIALCLVTTFLAASVSIGAAAEAPPATGRTATPQSADRMVRHPVRHKTEACPAPFGPTRKCPTATPKSAERMLRHPVTLKTEACPAPFDATTRCGVATVPADWAKPGGRTLGSGSR
jgi:hypothetical protein